MIRFFYHLRREGLRAGLILAVFILFLLAPVWGDNKAYAEDMWGEWIVDSEPSCTEAGQRHRVATKGNGAIQYEDIAPLGHDYRLIEVPATCTEDGVKTYTCSRSGDTYTEPGEAALGHDYVEVVTQEPTCLEEGVKTYTCSHDGNTYTEAIPALGHDFGEWNTETPAKPGKEGVEVRVCRRDGFRETREIAALPIEEKVEPARPVEAAAPPKRKAESVFPNHMDLIIAGVNATMMICFALLLIPYFMGMGYIRRRRKLAKEIQVLREAVAKKYDFD